MSETSALLDAVREVIRETLAERDRQAAAEQQAQAQAEQEELERIGRIGRLNLPPREKAALIDRLGLERYNQLPLYGEGPAARRQRSFPAVSEIYNLVVVRARRAVRRRGRYFEAIGVAKLELEVLLQRLELDARAYQAALDQAERGLLGLDRTSTQTTTRCGLASRTWCRASRRCAPRSRREPPGQARARTGSVSV